MKVRFAFICDSAENTVGGKVSALGIGIDTIGIRDLMKPAPPFTLVVNLSFARSEVGRKRVEVHLMGPDGEDVIPPMNAELLLAAPERGLVSGTGFVMSFHGIVFKRYGSHAISFVLDGNELISLPLNIVTNTHA